MTQETPLPSAAPPVSPAPQRILSIDAYRGLTMLILASGGLALSRLEKVSGWEWLGDQFTHREWVGCTFWDLIQPSFMFLVGASMPFAFAIRQAQGTSVWGCWGHVLKRALVLILVGVVLDSVDKTIVTVQLIRVLQQIALAYIVAFAFLQGGWMGQAAGVVITLGLHTYLMLDYGWRQGTDPWAKDANLGTWLDQLFHQYTTGWGFPNLLVPPRGSYTVLNFLPSTATLLLGSLAATYIKANQGKTVGWHLALAGLALLAIGWGLSFPIPLVKRIWTASFGLFAAGWTVLALSFFHTLTEEWKWRSWAWPLAIAGMNSLFLYVAGELFRARMGQILKPWVYPLLGPTAVSLSPEQLAAGLKPSPLPEIALSFSVLLAFWGIALWLHSKKIHFKA